jgi:hypothetical protein
VQILYVNEKNKSRKKIKGLESKDVTSREGNPSKLVDSREDGEGEEEKAIVGF